MWQPHPSCKLTGWLLKISWLIIHSLIWTPVRFIITSSLQRVIWMTVVVLWWVSLCFQDPLVFLIIASSSFHWSGVTWDTKSWTNVNTVNRWSHWIFRCEIGRGTQCDTHTAQFIKLSCEWHILSSIKPNHLKTNMQFLLHSAGSSIWPISGASQIHLMNHPTLQLFDLWPQVILNSQLQTSRRHSCCSHKPPGLRSQLVCRVGPLGCGRSWPSRRLQLGPNGWRPPETPQTSQKT